KPRSRRTLTADQIIDELRPKLARVPGVRVFLTNPPAIRIGGMMTRSQYQYALQDPDTDELYRVAPQFEAALHGVEEIEDRPAALSMLYVQAPAGKLVPLSAVLTTRQTVGPQSVNHIGQLPSVTMSFNLKQGVALGDAVAKVQQLARETLPATVSGSFQGTAQ